MSLFAATDWNVVSVESVGARRARREAAALNGPRGMGFPALMKSTREVKVRSVNADKVNMLNLAAVGLPRVAAPLSGIRPYFTSDARTFRSARATPPTGSGTRVVDFLK